MSAARSTSSVPRRPIRSSSPNAERGRCWACSARLTPRGVTRRRPTGHEGGARRRVTGFFHHKGHKRARKGFVTLVSLVVKISGRACAPAAGRGCARMGGRGMARFLLICIRRSAGRAPRRFRDLADRQCLSPDRPPPADHPGACGDLCDRGLCHPAAHRPHGPQGHEARQRAELHPDRRRLSRRSGQSRARRRLPTSPGLRPRRLGRGRCAGLEKLVGHGRVVRPQPALSVGAVLEPYLFGRKQDVGFEKAIDEARASATTSASGP